MKLLKPAHIALLLPCLPLSPIALADSEPLLLDPSVITGSRSASPSFDLPYSVDSINLEQINDGQLGINASEVLSRKFCLGYRALWCKTAKTTRRTYKFRPAVLAHAQRLVCVGSS